MVLDVIDFKLFSIVLLCELFMNFYTSVNCSNKPHLTIPYIDRKKCSNFLFYMIYLQFINLF